MPFLVRFKAIVRWIAFIALSVVAGASLAGDIGVSHYRLGVGDVISIVVFDEPDLSLAHVKLDDTGSLSYPMLGELKVKGLTVFELQQRITSGLKGKYLVNPHVTVTVDQYRDVFVNGQVYKPGNYPYQPGLTVRKAVSIAGGFKDRANKDVVSIIHDNQDASVATKTDTNALVEPGDIITIEESFF